MWLDRVSNPGPLTLSLVSYRECEEKPIQTSVLSIYLRILPTPSQAFLAGFFFFFFYCFSEKIRLDGSSESSARQRIHMKNQALFSSKD